MQIRRLVQRLWPGLFSIILTFVSAGLSPAFAQETQPGDACTTADEFSRIGGPENPGSGHFLVCDGSVWQPVLRYFTDGDVLFGSSGSAAAPLHVWGEAIVGNQGLACTAAEEGALRYTSATNFWEFCNGTSWRELATGSGAPLTLDELLDVDTTGVGTGDFLHYDGSNWVDRTMLLNDVSDVSAGSPATDEVLTWNGSNWVPQLAGGTPAGSDRQIQFNSNGSFGADANFTFTTDGRLEIVSGGDSVFVGTGAGTNDDGTSNANTVLGINALQFVSSGTRNTAVGHEALQDFTGGGNTAVGYRAAANIEGNDSVAIGNRALQGMEGATGGGNVAIGENALWAIDTGYQNTAVGFVALDSNTSGQHNNALGSWTLRSNTTGSFNVAIGHTALSNNTTGDRNTAVGHGALGWTSITDGAITHNTAVGNRAGFRINPGGDYNTFIGSVAGDDVTTGDNNVLLGYHTGSTLTTGSRNILIGDDVEPTGATVSDELNIGDTIYGKVNRGRIQLGNRDSTWIDDALSGVTDGIGSNDGVIFAPVADGSAAELRLYLLDDGDEAFTIWGDSCGGGNCSDLDAASLVAKFEGGGNVGIGDATPDHMLDVAGNIGMDAGGYLNFGDTDGSGGYGVRDNAGVIECKDSGGSWAACGGGGGGSGTPGGADRQIQFNSGGSFAADANFVFDASGNLGIGIGAPAGRMQVEGGDIVFLSNGGNSVGIGTASPTGTLHIMGFNDTLHVGDPAAAGEGGVIIERPSDDGRIIIQDSFDNEDVRLHANNTSWIDTGQNFGIGDSTPDHTLDVGGNIGMTAGSYLNFGDTTGSTGYGVRDNAGTIECKDSGGSWETCAGGTPAGADRQIQFNSNGSFGADANFTFTANGRLEIVSGGSSTFVGTNAGANDDGTSNNNTAFGWDALQYNSSSGNNTAVGYGAARNVVGRNNTAVGRNALSSATGSNGIENVAVGWRALSSNDGSSGSTAVGALALDNSTSSNNTAVGQWAARATTGGSNTVMGSLALYNNTTGSRNTAVGHYAMGNYSTSSSEMNRNTAIGYHAGYVLEGGNNNVFLGYDVGSSVSSGSDNILIGYDVEPTAATASNELNIGDTIYGDLSAGNVGIGNNSPPGLLDISGTGASTPYAILSLSPDFGAGTDAKSALNFFTRRDDPGTLMGLSTNKGWFFEAYEENHATAWRQDTLLLGGWDGSSWFTTMVFDMATNNVGIGDTTPDHTLDVAGNIGIASGGYLNFGDTDGSGGYGIRDNGGTIEVKDSGGSWTPPGDNLGDHTATQNVLLNGNWLSNDGGNEGVFVDTAGNVGIGTNSPGAKLEVGGQVKITGGSPGSGKVLTSDSAGLATWETPSSGETVPSGCSNIGDVCDDDTVYAGEAPGGRLYVERCNHGQTWDGSSCTGSIGWSSWGHSGVLTGVNSPNDGEGNTGALVGIGDTSGAYDCANKTVHSHSDWYMPAVNELRILYENRAAIGNFETSSTPRYQASTEIDDTYAWAYYFDGTGLRSNHKGNGNRLRCVRLVPGAGSGGPAPGTAISLSSYQHDIGIPNGVNQITIVFEGASLEAADDITIELGDSGGFETSGYKGEVRRMGASGTFFSSSFQVSLLSDASASYHGRVVLNRLTGNTWVMEGQLAAESTAGISLSAGSKTLSGTLTEIRITQTGGFTNFDAGQVNIMYQ